MLWFYLSLAGAGLIFFLSGLVHGGGDDFHGGDFHDHGGGNSHDGHADGSVDGTSIRDFMSLRSIALLALGFGLTGAIMTSLGIFGLIVPVLGVAVGLGFAYLGIQAIKLMLRQESSTPSRLDDFLSSPGTVVIAIHGSDVGQVLVSSGISGQERYVTARSENGQDISQGEAIEVISVVGGELVVRKAKALPSSF